MVGLVVTFKRLTPRSTSQDCCCQCSILQGATADPCLHRRPTLAGRFDSFSCGVTIPFLWSWCMQDHAGALPERSLCFPSPVKVLWSNPAGFQGQIPWGFQVSLPDPQDGKSDLGLRTLTTVEEPLWYNCPSVCESPTHQVWDLILLWLCPSYCFIEASSLSLDVRYLFMVVSSMLLSMVV